MSSASSNHRTARLADCAKGSTRRAGQRRWTTRDPDSGARAEKDESFFGIQSGANFARTSRMVVKKVDRDELFGWLAERAWLGALAIASNFDVDAGLQAAWGTGAIPASAAPDVLGAFRFICGAGSLAYDDPIVYPCQPGASHLPSKIRSNLQITLPTRAANCGAH